MSTQSLTAPETALRPVSERIALLDVLRGIALLGILLVNIAAFSGSLFLSPAESAHLPGAALTEPLDFALTALIEAKFYSLFSFLFGLGFAIISDRAEMHGARPTTVLVRRYFVLLGIGLIHSIFIWFGDILVLYSLLGMVLLLFRRMSIRRLLTWSAVMLLAPIPLYALFWVLLPASAGTGWLTPEKVGWVIRAVTTGHYPDIIPVNIYINEYNWFRRLVLMLKVSHPQALLIAVAIYAAQVVFSNVYVRYFRQGPAEWVWRRLTYGPGIAANEKQSAVPG